MTVLAMPSAIACSSCSPPRRRRISTARASSRASAARKFAAILPGADPLEAACAGEAVRHAFANSAAFVDGLPVGATVSVGAASDVGVAGDLNALLRRADAALYVAKRAGRNRVELWGPDDASPVAELEAAVRTARRKPSADLADPIAAKLRA